MKNKTKVITFFILFFVGVVFAAFGMWCPPIGIIDGSVLIFIGQVFVLAASIWGFEIHYDLKNGKFDAGKVEDNTNNSHN